MELDIRLQPSRILLCSRLLLLIAVLVAIASSGLGFAVKFLLFSAVPLLCWFQRDREGQICRGVVKRLSARADSSDIGPSSGHGITGTFNLQNSRYLDVHLVSCLCLHWLQVLTFKSHDSVRILVVLPDSCSSREQRYLRRLLTL